MLRLLNLVDGSVGERDGEADLVLAHDTDVLAEAPQLGDARSVEITFPAFKDGRGFTLARLLRGRCAFVGELRASGPLIPDQAFFLMRSGFDTLLIEEGYRLDAARASLSAYRNQYQPAVRGDAAFLTRGASA